MAHWLAPKELSETMAISAAPRSESLAPASGVDVSNQSHLFAALYKDCGGWRGVNYEATQRPR